MNDDSVTKRDIEGMSWEEQEEKVMLGWIWWDLVKEASGKPKESKAICGTPLRWKKIERFDERELVF